MHRLTRPALRPIAAPEAANLDGGHFPNPPEPDDRTLLDAYSWAVIGAVERPGRPWSGRGAENLDRTGVGRTRFGVIVAPDGYLLTNAHVVAGLKTPWSGWLTPRAAIVVGTDPITDLAVLRAATDGRLR